MKEYVRLYMICHQGFVSHALYLNIGNADTFLFFRQKQNSLAFLTAVNQACPANIH